MKSKLSQVMVILVVAISSSAIYAQDKSAGQVVLLDVAKVFRVNAQFEQAMNAIKKEAEGLKQQIEAKQNNIRQRAAEVAQSLEVGSTERNQQEAGLEQEQTTLRTQARQQETDLLKREAQIYYDTYTKMQGVVSRFAQENGIALVLRFDSGDIDPSNRNEVINGVNRAVVFHHFRDISKYIIAEMGPMTEKAMAEAQRDTIRK